jgi:hypothetical protein
MYQLSQKQGIDLTTILSILLILPGSFKNYEINICIKTHKTKNTYYNDQPYIALWL